jgi:hypothetical protein
VLSGFALTPDKKETEKNSLRGGEGLRGRIKGKDQGEGLRGKD